MKKYKVVDCQNCNFMDDTYDEPMTMNALRARFWSLGDCRTSKYSQFTKKYIEDAWEVKFEEANIKHKLIIKCLYDAQAECSCCGWYYCSTGEKTKKEIRKEFKKHLK